MRALAYLFITRFKNRIKLLVKSPATLVVLIIIIGLFLVSVFSMKATEGIVDEYRNISEVYALIIVLYSAVFVMAAYKGLSTGASLYSMPDINLIFTSPISSKKVLLYGLIQQMGTSLLIGLFLIFQYGWMHATYGTDITDIIVILLGYAAVAFCGQLTAMVLYSFTTGSDKKKRFAGAAIITLCGAVVLFVLLSVYPEKGRLLSVAVSVLNSPPVTFFPVGGWSQTAVAGIIAGNPMNVLYGLIALILYVSGFVVLMTKANTDYYEDVLQATEISYNVIAASKEGRIDAAMPQNIRIGKTGIGRGFGADSFYYKHRLESRRSRTLILDKTSLFFIMIVFIFALFMRNNGIIPIFCFAIYMQIFSVSLGRWIRELLLPFVYLVPEPAFKKLMHCLRESLTRISIEALTLFIPISLLLKMDAAETATCILARISFGLLFTAGNILVERLFSGMTVKILVMIIYFVVMVILVIPGVAAAITVTLAEVSLLPQNVLIFSTLTVCNVLVSLIVTFLCRNMLEYAELNYR